MNLNDKIYIAGHRGLVGSAILRNLESKGYDNLLTKNHEDLDLTDQTKVKSFFDEEKPDYVILAAAKVGGIYANNAYPADFIYQNTMIEANVIQSAFENKVKRLLFLGSTCIYPKKIEQPMQEEALLSNKLEPTNEPYALSKILGIKLCESYNRQHGTDFRSVMPTNLYGINDNFDPDNSHVIPGLIQRFHKAKINNEKEVIVWGTGRAMREFLYVDDMAEASLFVHNLDQESYHSNTRPMLSHINIGSGQDVTIKELAQTIQSVVGFQGNLEFDHSKPDGTPRKLMDVQKLSDLGWEVTTGLKQGLINAYQDFVQNHYAKNC